VSPNWDSLRNAIIIYGIRNSLYVALMPTASSANTLRNCEATEAHQSMIYTRDVKAGSFTVLNRHLYFALKEINLWSSNLAAFIAACEGTTKYIKHYILDHTQDFPDAKFETTKDGKFAFPKDVEQRLDHIMKMFLTMYDMSQKQILHQVRQRGIYVCQSQSTNIYMKDPTPVHLEALHLYTNDLRLKTGIYYLRQSPARSTGDFTLPAWLISYVKNLLGINKLSLIDDKSVSPKPSSKDSVSRSTSPGSSRASPISGTCSLKNKEGCVDCQA
jgi:ribonucleotide reductase alpha subunit